MRDFTEIFKHTCAQSDNVSLLDPEIPGFFMELKNQGIKIAINTGHPIDVQKIIMSQLGLYDIINFYTSSQYVGVERPNPEMLYCLMEAAKTNSLAVATIGGEFSVREAAKADCDVVIGVIDPTGLDTEEALKRLGADGVVKSIMELND